MVSADVRAARIWQKGDRVSYTSPPAKIANASAVVTGPGPRPGTYTIRLAQCRGNQVQRIEATVPGEMLAPRTRFEPEVDRGVV